VEAFKYMSSINIHYVAKVEVTADAGPPGDFYQQIMLYAVSVRVNISPEPVAYTATVSLLA
jgi:hypothetical protein